VPEEIAAPLAAWESFYVIVGSSAAALTGLTFVVIALIAEAPRGSDAHGIATFITPTIFHFCMVLLVSAILSAPWHGLAGVSVALASSAIVGLGYAAIVLFRAWRMRGYKLVAEDWLWHTVLPAVAYAAVALAALLLRERTVLALFVTGGAALLLLYIGIHNAWDTVTHITIRRLKREREKAG
jgi:hypothetical protein